MPTYYVPQTCKAKRPETNFPKVGTFLEPFFLSDNKEKEKTILFEVIWRLGATSNLMQCYLKVEVKSDQILNYLLSS